MANIEYVRSYVIRLSSGNTTRLSVQDETLVLEPVVLNGIDDLLDLVAALRQTAQEITEEFKSAEFVLKTLKASASREASSEEMDAAMTVAKTLIARLPLSKKPWWESDIIEMQKLETDK
jgi:hypothetical protein